MKTKRLISMILSLLLIFVSAPAAAADFDGDAYRTQREELRTGNWMLGTLSEDEAAVDAMLADMKADADLLYEVGTGYGLVNPEAAQSELFAFCQALPKGGDLHAHDYTITPVDRLLDVLLENEGTCIRLDDASLYASPAKGAIPLKKALEDGLTTREAIRDALRLKVGKTPRQEWDCFEPFFDKIWGLGSDMNLVEQIYRAGFESCVDNGVSLVELRLWLGDSDEENTALLNAVKNAYFSVKEFEPAFTVRIIGCNGKVEGVPVEYAEDSLRSAIRLSKVILDDFDPQSPRPFIIGLDLVNEEDSSRPMTAYADFFLSDEVQNSGLKLYIHCGESLRFDNNSVLDALLFGADRLGHAFNLYRYPNVMKELAERGIAVECCPVSNCLLGYSHDLRLHPGQYYAQDGVPVVLCSDDALFMEDAPLTEDYYAAILCWDLSLAEVKAFAENAILYSGLGDDEVKELHAAWLEQWDNFIADWSRSAELANAA